MPGVAFTRNGGRLGHGMGYYDKFLAEHQKKNPHRCSESFDTIDTKIVQRKTILLGLAFEVQIVDDLPLEKTDVLLDQIITA